MAATNDNRLLIVDDDKDTCANLSDILTDCGYTVDVAYRGWDALDLLRNHRHRLALLDYRLPGMTGVELFTRMRQVHGSLEALLVTGYASNETTRDALAAGVRHVVDKPVNMPQLMPLIEQALA